MWNNYFRPRRDLPQVNYNESSEDEDPFVSPERPVNTRAGSPVELAVPTLNDNVDEELDQVRQTLQNVSHTPLFRPSAPNSPDTEVTEAETVTGFAVQGGVGRKLFEPPEPPPPAAAAVGHRPRMVNFEDENGVDEAGALREAIKNLERLQWEDNDINFFFNQAEIKMTAVGAKKQYTKLQALSTILPQKVINEIKKFLRKKEDEFPQNDSYKQVKTEIIRIFGPKPEVAIDRALGRTLIGLPSSLARGIAEDVCQNDLDCRCCPAVIMALWKRHLPENVRAGISHYTLNKDNFNEVLQRADDIFQSSSRAAGAVAAVTVVNPTPSLDETQPAIPYAAQPVAAVSRGRGGRGGRGNRGGRGRGRGNSNPNSNNTNQQSSSTAAAPKHKGTKHPDLPSGEWRGCSMHFRWGRGAFFCSEPATCPWKNVYATKPEK